MFAATTTFRKAWPSFSLYRPHPPRAVLAQWLEEARALTRRCFSLLEAPQLEVPCLPIVNPPRWELGHVAWFQELWVHRRGDFDEPSLLTGADLQRRAALGLRRTDEPVESGGYGNTTEYRRASSARTNKPRRRQDSASSSPQA